MNSKSSHSFEKSLLSSHIGDFAAANETDSLQIIQQENKD